MSDGDAEVHARAAWSLVAEPGDATAGAVVAALGAPQALVWARWAVGVPPVDALRRLRALTRAADADRDADPGADAPVAASGPRPAPDLGPVRGPAPVPVPVPAPDPGSGPAASRVAVQDGLWPDPWSDGAVRVLARALPRWAPRLTALAPGRALDDLARLGGTLLVPGRPGWPVRFDDLGPAAPLCLWVRGDPRLDVATSRSVAVVGARAATAYGVRVAADLGAGLADREVTVVSGGAFGIDVAAHRGALAVDGATVALLAGGVDRPSPAGNLDVLERIADAGGALVAESPPGTVPSRARFLQRNRLIAALAGATVVVEAAWRSGALSTAARAAELLRPLGAVPGPVTSMASAGCHRLLRDGAAVCVTDADDVAELLGAGDVRTVGTRGAGEAGAPAIRGAGAGTPATAGAGEASPPPARGPGARTSATRGPGPAAAGDPSAPSDPVDRADSLASRVLDALPARRGIGVEAVARRAGLAEREVVAELGLLELRGAARRTATGWCRAPLGRSA